MSVQLLSAEEFCDGYDTFGAEQRVKVGRSSLNDDLSESITCVHLYHVIVTNSMVEDFKCEVRYSSNL